MTMTLYAQIDGTTVTRVITAPTQPGWEDGSWQDFSDPDVCQAWLDKHRFVPVVEAQRPDDTEATRHDLTYVVRSGVPTQVWMERPLTAAEVEAASRLTDLEARVARIEAHLWPADTDPQPSTAPTWVDLGGIWPAGTFLLDGGVVYRNVSGVPLTTPPSGFPGSPDQWGHLFQRATSPEPEPEPGAPAWTEGVAYKVDDLVTYAGTTYRCLQAHTAIVGWTPAAVPALWTPA